MVTAPMPTWMRRYVRLLVEYYRLLSLRCRQLYLAACRTSRSRGRRPLKRKASDWDVSDAAGRASADAGARQTLVPRRLVALLFLVGFVGYFIVSGVRGLLQSAASMGGMQSAGASTIASAFGFLFYRDPEFGFVMLLRSISSVLSPNRYRHCTYGWVTTAGCYGYGFIRKRRTFADMWHGCGLSPMTSGFCLCDAVR